MAWSFLKPRSLVDRVTRVTATIAVLSGAAVAIASAAISTQLMSAAEDAQMRTAALALAHEIARGPGTAEGLQRIVAQASDEVEPTGLSFAVFEGDALRGGQALDPPLGERAGCRPLPGRARRRCVFREGRLDIVVTSRTEDNALHREQFAAAGIAAVIIATLAAAIASRVAAAWAVQPLRRLQAAIGRVPVDAPSDAALGSGESGGESCSEVDAVRNALADLLTRLGSALSQSRRFAADASHELRTPLTTISVELELLRESPEIGRETIAAIDRVLETVSGLTALTERLLILASPSETMRLLSTAAAMSDVVSEALQRLSPADRARVQVLHADTGTVHGDARLLCTMIENAIDNALKFSGDKPVTIEVREAPGRVSIAVADQGPGLSREQRRAVFQPFYRAPQARAGGVKGYGVGLALISHIASAHQGHAEFVDVPRGARLEITIPAWDAAGNT